MIRALKYLGNGLAILLALIAVLAIGGWFWLASAQPEYSKTIESPALEHPVAVYRDEYGVPHIFAETHLDAMFALGYTQGQDRGWQMEFMRRAVDGRMSEIAGEMLVDLDKEFLATGTSRLVDLSFAKLSAETKAVVNAFAAGINAAIDAGEYASAPEFRAFQIDPQHWSARDVGALTYLIGGAFDPSSNRAKWSNDLIDDLGAERAAMLTRDYDDAWPTLFRDIGALEEAADRTSAALQSAGLPLASSKPGPVTGTHAEGTGTNFFLLGPGKTTTGAPILAVDPHLELDAPSLYYPASITLPDQVIRGGFWVTSPSIHFGHNKDIAWGMTSMAVASSYYVIEQIDPEKPDHYVRPEGSFPFDIEERQIKVRSKASSVPVQLRYTSYGLVVSDFSADLQALADSYGTGHVVVKRSSLASYGQLYLESGVKVQFAKDWDSFQAAFEHHGNGNTVAFADRTGSVGVQTAANIVVRKSPETWDTIPRAWLGEGDWLGLVPYAAMPYALNPPRPFIADSNARVLPGNYPLFFTDRASAPYRIKRSETVLVAKQRFSVEDVIDLQLDTVSTRPDVVLPAVAPYLDAAELSDRADTAWAKLKAWNRDMRSDSAEPLVYTGFEHALQQILIGEKVSDDGYGMSRGDPITLARLLSGSDKTYWCDRVASSALESCRDTVVAALETAISELAGVYGRDLNSWRWGTAHTARFANRYFLDFLPLVRDWAALEIEVDSGPGTLNVGSWSGASIGDYRQSTGAVWRQIIDLSNLDASLFQFAPGVSGNPSSPYYNSTLQSWGAGQYISFASSRSDLQNEGRPLTQLLPAD